MAVLDARICGGPNDEGTLAVPAMRDLVDLGDSPWSDHSPASMP